MKKFSYSLFALYTILMFSCISCSFAPGSYPYAERYEINCSESDLINAVHKFKEYNPEFNVPIQTQLKDGRRDGGDHWFHVYFYYVKENEIVKTWIRKTNKGTTTFAFVAINEGLTLGNWKDINKDYSSNENKLQKEKFEKLILNEIKNNCNKVPAGSNKQRNARAEPTKE